MSDFTNVKFLGAYDFTNVKFWGVRGQMPGLCPVSKHGFGQWTCVKSAKKGLKTAFLRGFGGIFEGRGQMPTFFLLFNT